MIADMSAGLAVMHSVKSVCAVPSAQLRRALLVFAMFSLGALGGFAQAQRPEASEASVKAAFLYKFAGYIEWGAGAFASDDAPFVIGVMGSDEVAAELARILPGRNIAGHPATVKKLRDGEAIRGAHLFFVARVEPPRLAQLLRAAQQSGALAVTDTDKGLEHGAAINFLVNEDRVGFEVSLDSAEKSGHRISSRMLTVARRVVPKAS
jgi:hypothetical protein